MFPRLSSLGQARMRHTPFYPMEVLNGLVVPKPDRQAPSSDYDETPRLFRRYVNASGVQDVQLVNGLRNRIGTGLRFSYGNAGYLHLIVPQNYAQRRRDPGGVHKRGPSPYGFQDAIYAVAGIQPEHPGGPGKIAAESFINPMTG